MLATAQRGARHLLQGLAVCKHCGYAYYGTLAYRSKKEYGYYRCIGTEAYRFGGERKCDNLPVYKDVLVMNQGYACLESLF